MSKSKILSYIEFIREEAGTLSPKTNLSPEQSYIPTEAEILRILEIQASLKEGFQKTKPTGELSTIQKFDSLKVWKSLSGSEKTEAMNQITKKMKTSCRVSKKEFDDAVNEFQKNAEEVKKNPNANWTEYRDASKVGKHKVSVYVVITRDEKILKSDVVTQPAKIEPRSFSFVLNEKSSQLFINNRWQIKTENLKETFTDPTYVKKLLEDIKSEIDDCYKYYKKLNKFGLTEIRIESSCSRYRNTETEENTSWAEMSYKRSRTFLEFMVQYAHFLIDNDASIKDKSKAKNDFIFNGIGKVTNLHFFGSNGDGTSGPDPDKNKENVVVQRGYYKISGDKAQWILDKSSTDLTMIQVVENVKLENEKVIFGKPIRKRAKDVYGKEITEIPKTPEGYEQYKYFQIHMTGNFLAPEITIDIPQTSEPEKSVKIKADILVPKDYSYKKDRTRSKDKMKGGGGGGVNASEGCPGALTGKLKS